MLISVAVPVPALGLLTYRVPDGEPTPKVGARVIVPLGSRVVTGLIAEVNAVSDLDSQKALKPIRRILDAEAFLPEDVIELALWTAEYYAAGPGEALLAALPPTTRGSRQDAHTVRGVVRITAEGLATGQSSELTAARKRALGVLANAPSGLTSRALSSHGIGASIVRALKDAGLVEVVRERVERDPFAGMEDVAGDASGGADRSLTTEQVEAFRQLSEMASAGGFQVALVHGVTGSGKTELYVRLSELVRGLGRSVLVLVPEIALTPAIASSFRRTFRDRVAIQHSGLSAGERHDQWQRIRQGEVDVVVGTRSAVFAPVARVGLIIVDEEHDASYKQEESPRYHGRDVAIVRGQRAGALVVLGSATPSMESHHHGVTGRYRRIVLERRVHNRPLPAVSVVDMRSEFAEAGPDAILSRRLREALVDRLARKEQALVLLNRRGFAVAVFCRQCGGTLDCPNCSVSLVVHGQQGRRRARCHYCNFSQAVPSACPQCAGPYLEHVGFGTERVESEVARFCPGARVARLDRDSVRRRGTLVAMLSKFASGAIDILVGTQMIAKGHDFPRVTLVGVVSADVGLGMPDFRAAERTFQLLTQVAGRAGRGETPGEAIVQTLYPDHYSVQCGCRQDYAAFAERERTFRQSMWYPPFVALINVVVRGNTPGGVMRDALRIADGVRERAEGPLWVLGPAPAPLARLRGEDRAQILLKGTHRRKLREGVLAVLAAHPDLARRTLVDVDPLSVL